MSSARSLILILGDQLSLQIPALARMNRDRAVILMAEVAEEAGYVPHHKKKLAFVFSAMRHFAEDLRQDGWQVDYVCLEAEGNSGFLSGELARALKRHAVEDVIVTEPGEYRLCREINTWAERFGVPVNVRADSRFLCTHDEFNQWAQGRKQLRMEYFYRHMRRRTGLLMEGDKPVGGRWNFDSENRKPATRDLLMPRPLRVAPDKITRAVLDMVEQRFPDNFGRLDDFWFAVTAKDARQAAQHFIDHALAGFGDYQDAMLEEEKFLYHGVLSHYLNAGLLDPMELCRAAETAYHAGRAPLNAVEGFIRQIIGWREYIRGIYWREMPGYLDQNHLQADRALPGFYWTARTEMNCLHRAISQTAEEAYAHHIQRLMVTGNFALLAGIDPQQLHEWYLAAYADAYEWVELPNTLGMSQFADGGLLASKPYAASGAYIHRMSDYCGNCRYDVKKKTGPDACPLNSLYWDFMARNEPLLSSNPRLGPFYRTWHRMAPDRQHALRAQAEDFLIRLDQQEGAYNA